MWKIQTARVTLFPMSESSRSVNEMFRALWGREPDNFQKQPAVAGQPAAAIASATIDQFGVSIGKNPIRTDLSLSPVESANVEPGAPWQVPLFSSAQLVLDEINRLLGALEAEELFKMQVGRVATYFAFASEANSIADANAVAAQALPANFNIPLSDELDFVLQLNNVVDSAVIPNIKVNRLIKWATERVQTFTFALNAGVAAAAPQLEENFLATVGFDTNNAPSQLPLDPIKGISLLKETLNVTGRSVRSTLPEIGWPSDE